MTTKAMAREWLLFLGSLVVGLSVFPMGLQLAFRGTLSDFSDFYQALYDSRWWGTWLIVLIPYVAAQLVRSIMWAWRVVRE